LEFIERLVDLASSVQEWVHSQLEPNMAYSLLVTWKVL
jgi:hypothetical protein